MRKILLVSLIALTSVQYNSYSWLNTKKFESLYTESFRDSNRELFITLNKILETGTTKNPTEFCAKSKHLPSTMSRINKLMEYQIRTLEDFKHGSEMIRNFSRLFSNGYFLRSIDDEILENLENLCSHISLGLIGSEFYFGQVLGQKFELLDTIFSMRDVMGVDHPSMLHVLVLLEDLLLEAKNSSQFDFVEKIRNLIVSVSGKTTFDGSDSHLDSFTYINEMIQAYYSENYGLFLEYALELNKMVMDGNDPENSIVDTLRSLLSDSSILNILVQFDKKQREALLTLVSHEHFGKGVDELRQALASEETPVVTSSSSSSSSSSVPSSSASSSSSYDSTINVKAETEISLAHLLRANPLGVDPDHMTREQIKEFLKKATIPANIVTDWEKASVEERVQAFINMFYLDI